MQQRFILFLLWLMVFGSASQIMITAPILPQIGQALSIPEHLLGTLVTAYVLMMGITALIAGPISDKIGRRRILMIGTGGMGFALLAHLFAVDYFSFLGLRALAGLFGGILSGAAVAYVGDYFPYEKRGWANGIITSGLAFGQVAGIPLGIYLSKWYDFHASFTLFAIPMLLAFVLMFKFLPEPQIVHSKMELTVKNALHSYQEMLKNSKVFGACLAFTLMFFSLMLFIVFYPKWLTQTFGMKQEELALMYLVGGIANVLVSPFAGKLSDKIGRKPLIIGSSVGMSILLGATTFWVKTPFLAYVSFFLAMMMVAMRISPLQALMTTLTTPEKRGSLMSLTVAVGQVGGGLGSALAGYLYGQYGFLSNSLVASFFILMMAVVVWKMLPEPLTEKERIRA